MIPHRFVRVLSLGFAFVARATVATTAMYLLYRQAFQMFAWAPFTRAASTGKLYVRVLSDIREGRVEKATERLEMVLDSDIMTLGSYEDAMPPGARDRNIYVAAALLRQYRQGVPPLCLTHRYCYKFSAAWILAFDRKAAR